jgi:hypothetical protein
VQRDLTFFPDDQDGTVLESIVTKLLGKLGKRRTEDASITRVRRALALHRRGEVRTDGLELTAVRTTMRVEWVAREIHPWDRNIRRERRERFFTQQCLDDTAAAIGRLFEKMPDLNTLEIRVLREASGPLLLAGVVNRDQIKPVANLAPGMKLKTLGIRFQIFNWQLEPLSAPGQEAASIS